MTQQTGETRDAIIEADTKDLQAIVYANRHRKDVYWVVIFAKPAKVSVEGKPTLIKHIKPYYKNRPGSQVGMIVGAVNNSRGTIQWEVNMPQRPFDFDALLGFGAQACDECVVETTTIAGAYVTQ